MEVIFNWMDYPSPPQEAESHIQGAKVLPVLQETIFLFNVIRDFWTFSEISIFDVDNELSF
jgi:hypothetical protein